MKGENEMQTIVIPSDVHEIADDAFANCGGQDGLYIREGADIDCLPGHVAWDCVKVPQSQSNDFFEDEETWDVVTNGFFSGTEVRQPEFTLKRRDNECVRWLELRPREFQYICSLAFDMPREECEEVGGRWLFTHSPRSGDLLLQLASAFMEGNEVEQDFPMALRCCEQACWCAVGDGIPFTPGESFPGIEIGEVDQLPDPEIYGEWIDLFKRTTRLKDDVLTHFQRLDIGMFERRGTGDDIMYFIPAHAFEGREDLRDVLLPDELYDKHVRIGRETFARCTNLRSISVAGMSDSFVLSRHANSFEGCDSLSDRMQYSADGSKLLFCLNAPAQCTICGHVREIADYAFVHSRALIDFSWGYWYDDFDKGGEVRKIEYRAFEGCTSLERVFTGGREISLRTRAFAACRHLGLYRFGFVDVQGEDDVPPSFLDVSGVDVFEGCEMLLAVEPENGRDKGFLAVSDYGFLGGKFSGCRELRTLPPIISTGIPVRTFASCESLAEIRCVVARPDAIKAVLSGKRPAANSDVDDYIVSAEAFAHCRSLERFRFCRLRVSFRGSVADVDLIDDNPRSVLFQHEAFLDCGRLSRGGSSFANALQGSDPSAFSGCPEFDGFVDE